MSDTSSHSSSSKKSIRSIKKKRADKKADGSSTRAHDPVAHIARH